MYSVWNYLLLPLLMVLAIIFVLVLLIILVNVGETLIHFKIEELKTRRNIKKQLNEEIDKIFDKVMKGK